MKLNASLVKIKSYFLLQGVPKTWEFSDEFDMSARVYFMKRVKDCKDVSIMSPQFSCFTKYNRMQSKHKQTKCEHSRRHSYRLQLSQ